jgi:glycine cleavage system H protein
LGKVYAPVNGELVGVNEDLEENPGLINEDCYGKGWMYKIKADDMNELETLMRDPDDLREWLKAEIAEHGRAS